MFEKSLIRLLNKRFSKKIIIGRSAEVDESAKCFEKSVGKVFDMPFKKRFSKKLIIGRSAEVDESAKCFEKSV